MEVVVLIVLSLVLSVADARPSETPVRASFGDGQVLMGDVRTETLVLMTGAGIVDIPLSDVGEVVPADGEGLAEARGRVTVWLRNGSELRGTWTDPTLAMRVKVGGEHTTVDLPLNDLQRFQLQGRSEWASGPVYRLKTAFGDDVLVDPARTTLIVHNQFGTFEPRLSECTRVEPVGATDGDWRVELASGTILIGNLDDNRLTVALPMGPDHVSLPLADVVSLSTDSWQPRVVQSYTGDQREEAYVISEFVASAGPSRGRRPSAMALGAASTPAEDAWFDRSVLEASKAQ
ncbi:MAG: hypothetical protein ACJATT_005022 [Myxococcota bacterium]